MTDEQAFRRIVALGDSIVVHRGDPVDGYPTHTWTEQIVLALAPDAYVNLGVSGARAAEIRAGQLAQALKFRPDLVFLAAGANDAARRSFRPDRVEAELERMMEPLSRAGALVVTVGCFDLSATLGTQSTARLRVLDDLTARLSRRFGGRHVSFARRPARSEIVLGSDGVHINARGHAEVAATVRSHLGFAQVG